jgi:beta-barrel assembly-enhancing protease
MHEEYMCYIRKSIIIAITVIFAVGSIIPPAVYSLTVKEEEELSQEVLRTIFKQFEVIDDPLVVTYVNNVGNRILATLPEQPFQYRFYVIREEVYNAFAIPAGHIFIYSGLIEAMEEEEELAGILGHEIAHVYARHISKKIERSKKIGLATLAGVAAGILLGVGGAGEAASALTMGSVAAGRSAELAYSREDEMQADQFGLKFITAAGYSASGLLKVLKKIRSKQWFGSEQIPTYLMTHPAVEDRIAYLDSWLENYGHTAQPIAAVNQEEFKRVHTRIQTQYMPEQIAISKLAAELARNPEDPMAHYRYGLILARSGKRQEAIEHMRIALTKRAFDPYILKDFGRIYFLNGQYPEALKTLESASSMIPNDPECNFYLARTRMELGQMQEATNILLNLIQQHAQFAPAFYYLGQSLGNQGNLGEAHYYLGIYYVKKRDVKSAVAQFQLALKHQQNPEKRAQIEKLLSEINRQQAQERSKKEG